MYFWRLLGLGNFKFTSATEYLASKAYTTMVTQLGVQKINKPSILFGFGPITKEV